MTDIVMPGDRIQAAEEMAATGKKVILGPGLRRVDDKQVTACKAGKLHFKEPNTFWVDSYQRRYVPVRSELVIGVVTAKAGDLFRVDIGAPEQASLSYLAFEQATKKNRPDVNVGDLLYARLVVANKDFEPELVCVNSSGKKGKLGVLSEGFVFNCSLNLVRLILREDCPLLSALKKEMPFEVAVGMNGRIWIRAKSVKETIAMAFLEIFGGGFLLYYFVYVLFWIFLDCNFALWFKSHFGVSISTLRGQVVWITGASSGIGRALALNLAKHGVKLVLSARRLNLLEEVKKDCLLDSCGLLSTKDVLVLPMDILKLEEHEKHFKKVLDHFGRLDILVNNAGRSQRANWEEIHTQVDRDLFELDVFSVLHLSRVVVRYFLEQNGGRGHVAITSSVAGLAYVPSSATYCAAKHAVNAYFGCLVVEQPSINVTVFNPGPVATEFLLEAFTDKPDEKVGKSIENHYRLTAERCGFLFAVALANKIELSWCGRFPVNMLVYIFRHSLLLNAVRYLLNKKTLQKIREGKSLQKQD
uniref:Ribosomal RNA-processing protein 40 n=1 Tax=Glossina morsitans morsitans TaxID=37546 RepID=A0A1B0FIR4_GLOMM